MNFLNLYGYDGNFETGLLVKSFLGAMTSPPKLRANKRVHRSAASEFLNVPSVSPAAPGDAGR